MADADWRKLGAEPGLCEDCRYAKLNETRRDTAYLRCTRAAWDAALPRYPRLPVTECAGFERCRPLPALGAEEPFCRVPLGAQEPERFQCVRDHRQVVL
jgi:hypothetical protein